MTRFTCEFFPCCLPPLQKIVLPPTHNFKSRIYEICSIKKGVKLQFDRIFANIYYAKMQCLRTFHEFCSNPCRSDIRKMKIADEWSLMLTYTVTNLYALGFDT